MTQERRAELQKNLVNLDMTKIYKNNSLDINSNFDIFLVKFIHFFFSGTHQK